MEHRATLTFPPADARAAIISEDFLAEFSAAIGVEVSDLYVSQSGEHSLATMNWTFRTDIPGVPELGRVLLPSKISLSWDQSWGPLADDQTASGRLTVRLDRRPQATVNGTCSLRPQGAGSLLLIDTTTSADLPFPIKGRVEGLIDRELIGWIVGWLARVLERRAGVSA